MDIVLNEKWIFVLLCAVRCDRGQVCIDSFALECCINIIISLLLHLCINELSTFVFIYFNNCVELLVCNTLRGLICIFMLRLYWVQFCLQLFCFLIIFIISKMPFKNNNFKEISKITLKFEIMYKVQILLLKYKLIIFFSWNFYQYHVIMNLLHSIFKIKSKKSVVICVY